MEGTVLQIRKWLSLMLAVTMGVMCFIFTACGEKEHTPMPTPPPIHEHTYSAEWTSDTESHWHKCTYDGCTEINDKEAHSSNPEGKCTCGVSKMQIVNDNKFSKGFNVKGQQDGINKTFGKLTYDDDSAEPAWGLAQWYCGYYKSAKPKPKKNEDYNPDYNILNGTKTYNEKSGQYIWTDASKTLRVNPVEGTIYARLDATKEYTSPRADGGPWPHLLMSYTVQEGVRVSDLSALTLKFDYTLKTFKDGMGGIVDVDLHCAQFPFYCVVRNMNPDSADYKKYMWFGACMYDNRSEYVMTYASADIGSEDKIATGAFIYRVGQKTYLDAPVFVDEKNIIDWDMLPYIKIAYNTARERGFLTNTAFEDLYVTEGNFGWEVTGTYDAAMQIDRFEIIAVKGITE